MNKSNKFFIIGIRRSGTTILKKIIQNHKDVSTVLFEPHFLLTACFCRHIQRYWSTKFNHIPIEKLPNYIIEGFKHNKGRVGAKFALHPGYQAMYWKRLNQYFTDSPFVFIIRNKNDNYASWIKAFETQIEGIIPKNLFHSLYEYINNSFIEFNKENPNRSCIVKYENLVTNTDKELEKVWKTIGVNKNQGNNKFIKKPENWIKRG